MVADQHYDFIIAGAGCAGLSLAYRLSQSTAFTGKTMLIIDRDAKDLNDRTWCFWEKTKGPFEHLVHQEWEFLDFFSSDFHKPLHINPYRYKMIRGIDFYQFTKNELAANARISWVKASVLKQENTADGAIITTDTGVYNGKLVFSSLMPDRDDRSQFHYLLQHFKGWVIETEHPVFDPGRAILMDFRVPQYGDTRFCYVLPVTDKRALVEYTLFSPALLEPEAYDRVIDEYLRQYLQITEYRIAEKEFGIIPMTDMPFPAATGQHILHIGTAGGNTKASTGYTFVRIQRQVSKLILQLEKTGTITHVSPPSTFWYRWMDRIFLNVLSRHRYPADRIFTLFFKKNSPDTVLDFLDEQSTLKQDMMIILSQPVLPFLKALLDELLRWSRRRNIN